MGVVGLLLATACGEEMNDDSALPDEQGGSGELAQPGCKVAGCSNELCINEEDEVLTTCEWKEEYACYSTAVCAKQSDNQCNWVSTPQLKACVARAQEG